ncbi:SDR family NAD(P)-dependent oxidoreductase [Actinopolymorpha alba]|uniref:SDR family NAD(P)-dependent oxidoreductase n=1 Tax=Actinopolymorpha alba TaxID=533267 RepID=UPI0003683D7A|nr:SDR family NAD(P)-dependent oxidoreductase [Actinopolymorpha alba]
MRLSGTFAVVTGASSGIGQAVAERLASMGCQLLLVGRNPDRLHEVARRTGGEPVVADLENPDALADLAARLAKLQPAPDLLINNAGIGRVGSVSEPDGHHFERLLAVNLRAPVTLTQAVLPAMLERGRGHLVFVSSIAAMLGVAREAGYAAGKAGLHVFAASVHAEVAQAGIGVTTVVPGIVDTDFFARRGTPYPRRFPRPLPPARIADALIKAVERERVEVIVPRWLRVPVALRALAPTTYARLAGRWG